MVAGNANMQGQENHGETPIKICLEGSVKNTQTIETYHLVYLECKIMQPFPSCINTHNLDEN